MKLPNSINRRIMERYVNIMLNKRINNAYLHCCNIYDILTLLLDEILKELESGNPITIGNFCKFEMKQLNDRIHTNVVTKEKVITKGKKTIRISIDKQLASALTSLVDLKALRKSEGYLDEE